MSLQIYILTKLMEENSYPYKVKKALSEPVPFAEMSNLTDSKLYYHFDSLAKKQMIEEVEIIHEANRPDKHIFGITPKGREALPEMIYKMIDKAQSPMDMVVGINAMQYVDKSRVIDILEQKVARIKKRQHELNTIYERIEIDEPTLQYVDVFERFVSESTGLYIATYQHFIRSLLEADENN